MIEITIYKSSKLVNQSANKNLGNSTQMCSISITAEHLFIFCIQFCLISFRFFINLTSVNILNEDFLYYWVKNFFRAEGHFFIDICDRKIID